MNGPSLKFENLDYAAICWQRAPAGKLSIGYALWKQYGRAHN